MAWLPVRDQVCVASLRLFCNAHLLRAERFDVGGVGGPTLVPLLLRLARLQLHGAHLVRDQRRTRPEIVLFLGEQVPAQHRQLARAGGDLMAAPDPDEEGVLASSQPPIDQHRPGVAAPDFADPPVMSSTEWRPRGLSPK